MALPSNSTIAFTSTNGGTPVFGLPSGYTADYVDTTDESIYAVSNLSDISLTKIGNFTSSYPVNQIKPFYFYFNVPEETKNNGNTTGTLTIQITSPGSEAATPVVYTVKDAA